MTELDWDVAAKLLRMEGEPNRQIGRGAIVSTGPLASLVREMLAQPKDDQWRYSIVRTVGPMLDCKAFELLRRIARLQALARSQPTPRR